MGCLRVKIITSIIAFLLVAFEVIMFFIDKSSDTKMEQLASYFLLVVWSASLPQTIVYYFFKFKNSGIEYSIDLGLSIGSGCFLGLLLAPYYGVKFYLVDLANLKWNGEIIM